MPPPLIVSVPHHLGKDEALRRLKSGLATVQAKFGHVLSVEEETWTDDHLQFKVSALMQTVTGAIDVAEDHVRLEVTLPGLLGRIANTIQATIQKQGTLMLDKK